MVTLKRASKTVISMLLFCLGQQVLVWGFSHVHWWLDGVTTFVEGCQSSHPVWKLHSLTIPETKIVSKCFGKLLLLLQGAQSVAWGPWESFCFVALVMVSPLPYGLDKVSDCISWQVLVLAWTAKLWMSSSSRECSVTEVPFWGDWFQILRTWSLHWA